MLRETIRVLKSIDETDLKILNIIERGMSRYMYVPLEHVSRELGWSAAKVSYRLKRLNSMGLVMRRKGEYVGYILLTRGYDCLALNALIKKGVLEAVSTSPVGVGKEADVYKGLTPRGEIVAVKFHRLGRTSFRQVRRGRRWVGERRHISWLYQSRLAAHSEYTALELLYPHGLPVPQPVAWNRHVVVTSFIEGVRLADTPPLDDPGEVFENIVEIAEAILKTGIVHGDLSEYNILINEKIIIFDWPQWLDRSHPSAFRVLVRDLTNLARFFERKYGLRIDYGEIASRFRKYFTP